MTLSARTPFLALAALVVVVAACSGTASATPDTGGPVAPTPRVETPAPSAPATPPAEPTATPKPDQGNVGNTYPELSVDLGDGSTYLVGVTDPEAKAWRFDVRGLGILADDRLEIIVEVSDIEPAAEARIFTRGALVDIIDMDGMVGNETVAAGGCHPTLYLCFGSDGLAVDPETGRATMRLEQTEPRSFAVQGATAEWPAEPFVLGPWRTTEPFTTN